MQEELVAGDVVVKYSIVDGAKRRAHSNRQFDNHFGATRDIPKEPLSRSRVVNFEKLKLVTPTIISLRRQGCKRLGISRNQNIRPGGRPEVKRTDRRTSDLGDSHSNAEVQRTRNTN